jgi:hypothetical protein
LSSAHAWSEHRADNRAQRSFCMLFSGLVMAIAVAGYCSAKKRRREDHR